MQVRAFPYRNNHLLIESSESDGFKGHAPGRVFAGTLMVVAERFAVEGEVYQFRRPPN